MAGGIDHAVGSAADEVAKGGQQLEKNGGRMGFGVRSDGMDGEPGETLEGGFAQHRDLRAVGAMVAAPEPAWVTDPDRVQAAGPAVGVGDRAARLCVAACSRGWERKAALCGCLHFVA